MPKQLITVIGLVISLGIIALGVFLVALPLYLQSVSVAAQTATVAQTNAIYQTQVDLLRQEETRQAEIEASVGALRSQIPAVPQLDDAFEVIAGAAQTTGVAIEAVTAGEITDFVERTGPVEAGVDATGPAATTEGGAATEGESDGDGATPPPDGTAAEEQSTTASRQQVPFEIRVVGADMGQVTAFLDALRAGPRLLGNITSAVTQTEPGKLVLSVSALTYIDTEG